MCCKIAGVQSYDVAGAGAGAKSYNSAGAGAGAEKPEFAQH
jgi:hypothetical protein